MATKIEWVRNEDGTQGETWNITVGCDKTSPGCDHCYAIRTATIRAGNPHPAIAAAYAGLTHRTETGLDWTGTVRLLPGRLTIPLHWRKPRRIFVDSQSDLFHKDVPDDFIAHAFAVMAVTPRHTYQVLTKRHGRMRSLLSNPDFIDVVIEYMHTSLDLPPGDVDSAIGRWGWPLLNVWVGVSVEDQKRADLRIPALCETPAAVRWLSCEPLLGHVDLSPALLPDSAGRRQRRLHGLHSHPVSEGQGIDWVVVGGESGPGARPMHPRWASRLRDQCVAAGVPFLFKQWGDWSPMAPLDDQGRVRLEGGHTLANDGTLYGPGDLVDPDGPRYGEALRADHGRAELTAMYRLGKKAAGRELAGQLWDEFPV